MASLCIVMYNGLTETAIVGTGVWRIGVTGGRSKSCPMRPWPPKISHGIEPVSLHERSASKGRALVKPLNDQKTSPTALTSQRVDSPSHCSADDIRIARSCRETNLRLSPHSQTVTHKNHI